MLNSIDKNHLHHRYYTKRLNTQLFRVPSLKDQFIDLTDKIQHEMHVVKRNMRLKNAKMFKAKERKTTIQNQQQLLRTTLRTKIQQKSRISQKNLQKLMLNKSSQSKSKQKLRETTLSRIKSLEKNFIEQSFKKSQQCSKNSETFFYEKNSEKISKNITYRYSNKKLFSHSCPKYQNHSLHDSYNKILPKLLKITDDDIKTHQSRKISLEKGKEIKNLSTYIQKLYKIDLKRKTRQDNISETVKLLEKARGTQKNLFQNRKVFQSNHQIQSKTQSFQVVKEAISNKMSFSQMYSKKLEEKRTKKLYFAQISMRQGNKIIADSQKQKKQKRNNTLLKQSLKQMQLRANFRYMQKLKKL